MFAIMTNQKVVLLWITSSLAAAVDGKIFIIVVLILIAYPNVMKHNNNIKQVTMLLLQYTCSSYPVLHSIIFPMYTRKPLNIHFHDNHLKLHIITGPKTYITI